MVLEVQFQLFNGLGLDGFLPVHPISLGPSGVPICHQFGELVVVGNLSGVEVALFLLPDIEVSSEAAAGGCVQALFDGFPIPAVDEKLQDWLPICRH